MDSESSQQFCLKWHNHQSSVLGGLPALLDSGRLTDVTLCAGGRSLRAHRIVLSTCSPYFMDIFKELPASQQPVVVVLGGGWPELCCLVAFMYAGEVTLPRALLPKLLRLARALRITGLTDLNGNIPEVPLSAEFEDSFTSKFDSSYSTTDETKFNRQNSDSTSCAESVPSPFQRSFESHLASRSADPAQGEPGGDLMQEQVYQGLQMLKNFAVKQETNKEKPVKVKEEFPMESTKLETTLSFGKKCGRTNEGKRYLNPILNELEPKNRKIDKIVENLKSNQRKSNILQGEEGTPRSRDPQEPLVNLSRPVDPEEKSFPSRKSLPHSVALTKAANLFASNNIFMETDPEGASGDTSPENLSTPIKAESESSPEIMPEMKYVPLLPAMRPLGIHSPTNTKLFATCYVCHKQLSNQYNLRVHLETHQNARHACGACNHVSRSRDALRKHVSYRHPQLNTSHGVGRPCKANQLTQTATTLGSPTPPPGTALMFPFSGASISTSDTNDPTTSPLAHSNTASENMHQFGSLDLFTTSQTSNKKDHKK